MATAVTTRTQVVIATPDTPAATATADTAVATMHREHQARREPMLEYALAQHLTATEIPPRK